MAEDDLGTSRVTTLTAIKYLLTLDDVADFTWGFGSTFHLDTTKGSFEWSDPEYGGDNTIRPCPHYNQWCERQGIEFGRDKGTHIIRDYCGADVTIVPR